MSSDIAAIFFLIFVLLLMAGGLIVIFFPPHRTIDPPDPESWPADDLWTGEEVGFATFAVMEVRGGLATGFLYLTNFRLLFVPSSFPGLSVPPLDRPSETIRLTKIEKLRLRRWFREDRLHVS